MFAKSQTQCWCCSRAFACVICKYELEWWQSMLQWPAVWERGRGRVPLLKCQRSALKLPGPPPPVSLQDTTASATAVLQPCTGSHKGRVTPSEWGLTEDFFHSFIFRGKFCGSICLNLQGNLPPASCGEWKKLNWKENVSSLSPDWKTYRFWMAYWQYWFTWLLFCCFFLVLPFARWTWALWQSSSGCFTYVYWFGSPKYCLIENSFHSKKRSENMSDCIVNLQNKNQIKYSFWWEYLWLIINSGL